MMCIYCKGYDAENVGGIPLCASCAGRFVEASAPTLEDERRALFDAVSGSSQPLPLALIDAAASRSVSAVLRALDRASEPLPMGIFMAAEPFRNQALD